MTQFDAFTQGITVGGMRTKKDLKILLCYILKTIGTEITKTNLENLFQTTQLANYFEVGDAISTLKNAGVFVTRIDEEGEEYYTVSKLGAEIAGELDTELPKSTRNIAVSAALDILAREKTKRCVETEIQRLERGYNVILTVKNGNDIMMQTVLYAADGLQADTICNNFTSDPTKVYAGIIELLTH